MAVYVEATRRADATLLGIVKFRNGMCSSRPSGTGLFTRDENPPIFQEGGGVPPMICVQAPHPGNFSGVGIVDLSASSIAAAACDQHRSIREKIGLRPTAMVAIGCS